jgi:ribose-phosphate pyrophosphokinase
MGDPFMATGFGELKVFSGSAHQELTREIAAFLGVQVGQARLRRFPDSEVSFQIDENIRGTDVFIVQPTCNPVDQHIMEMLIMIDAFKRSSAARITAVLPYFGYARQDRKDKPRVPISAKLVANLLVTAGAQRILTIDLHAPAIEGFFDIPVDHLRAAPLLADYFRSQELENLVVVSPDAGGVARAEDFRIRAGGDLAIIAKKRPQADRPEVIEMVGDVAGKTAVIVDDMISTGGTLIEATELLLQRGAGEVYACAVHALFADGAIQRMASSGLRCAIVTDTVPVPECHRGGAIEVLSVAPLLAEAIMRIHKDLSISALFT